MDCPKCKQEMELIDTVDDYFNPYDYHGHGQIEDKCWFCSKCEETEDYIYEPDEL